MLSFNPSDISGFCAFIPKSALSQDTACHLFCFSLPALGISTPEMACMEGFPFPTPALGLD